MMLISHPQLVQEAQKEAALTESVAQAKRATKEATSQSPKNNRKDKN